MTKFIDFVPRRPQQAIVKHPVAEKPIAKKVVIAEPDQKQRAAVKETKPKARPAPNKKMRRMDFVRRPASAPLPEIKAQKKTVRISVNSRPAPKSEVEPLMEDDELSLALAGFADDEDTPSLIDSLSKEANDLEEELSALDELDAVSDDLEAEIADFVEEPKPMFAEKKTDAPDANKYSLGGRSPFLSSVRVEKRPLSSFVSSETKTLKAETRTPVKNSYRTKIKQVVNKVREDRSESQPPRRRETTIISTPKDHANGIGLSIAIILTVILGAAIGAVLYLVFFQ